MNLDELFAVRMSIAEIIIRGSCIYWFLFLIFRFPLRRDVGSVGVADILTVRHCCGRRAERHGG
jgi:hypothetical protein